MLDFRMQMDNFFLASIIEQEALENDINQMVDMDAVNKEDVDYLLQSYGVRFYELPEYLQKKIDTINIV
jgi:hypothetical protein